jgi:hypothetical protein
MANTNSDKPNHSLLESLLHISWYTADSARPLLIKAGADKDIGYIMLVTNLEKTYFCAGDVNTIILEKKVRINH